MLIVENDLGFRALPPRRGARAGIQGHRDVARRRSPCARAASSSRRRSRSISSCPDINGWRVLHRIKNDAATRHIPVTVISTDESREQALESGAYAFVAKPIQSKEVLDGLLDNLKRVHAAVARGACWSPRRTRPRAIAWCSILRPTMSGSFAASDRKSAQRDGRAQRRRLPGARRQPRVVDTATIAAGGKARASRRSIRCRSWSTAAAREAEALNGWRNLAKSAVVRDVQLAGTPARSGELLPPSRSGQRSPRRIAPSCGGLHDSIDVAARTSA